MSFNAIKTSIDAAIANEQDATKVIADHIAESKRQALAQIDALREFTETTFDNLAAVIAEKSAELIGEEAPVDQAAPLNVAVE